jgi:hypothetical protein
MIKGFVKLIVILAILYFVFTHLSAIQAFLNGMSGPGGVPIAQAASAQLLRKHSSNLVMNVARLDQNSIGQYNDAAEYNTWSGAACSAAASAEVLNFYAGREKYSVHDVLKVEMDNGDISSHLGLLSHSSLARVAAHYHFNAVLNESDTLDHVIEVAKSGHPVIVNWPPDRFAGGHFVVVRGGNASTVYLTDSSSNAYPSLSRSQFANNWEGFSAVLTPKGEQ